MLHLLVARHGNRLLYHLLLFGAGTIKLIALSGACAIPRRLRVDVMHGNLRGLMQLLERRLLKLLLRHHLLALFIGLVGLGDRVR